MAGLEVVQLAGGTLVGAHQLGDLRLQLGVALLQRGVDLGRTGQLTDRRPARHTRSLPLASLRLG